MGFDLIFRHPKVRLLNFEQIRMTTCRQMVVWLWRALKPVRSLVVE